MTQKKTSTNKNTQKSGTIATGVGIGLAAATAAAGVYLLAGKEGKQNRKMVKSWALKAEKEILRQLKTLKDASKPSYEAVVDKVAKGYEGLKHVDQDELTAMVKGLKGHWANIQREIKKAGASVSKTKKAVVKKPAPKSRKK